MHKYGIQTKGTSRLLAKGGRASLRFGGGRTNLLEELDRVEGERSNPNRRAEISRVHGELNRGYAKGGRAGFAHGEQAETWDKRREGVGAAKRKPHKSFRKKKKYTKEQLAMHKSIKEKRHGGKKFKGKVFDASPIQLAKAGMTESKMYGLPAHSQKYVNGKLQYAKPYGGTIDTGFKGYDKSTPGVGLKSGGRIGFKKGTDKKWMQKVSASIKKRGTKGKCTPITKPGCTGRAKALAKTFKKIAAKRKA